MVLLSASADTRCCLRILYFFAVTLMLSPVALFTRRRVIMMRHAARCGVDALRVMLPHIMLAGRRASAATLR